MYCNEIDPYAAQWLRNLWPDAVVDERSIVDVQPNDVVGYRRAHFFAGIGGWEYALELARWGDREVWTGSCPCQPFSGAGKAEALGDERHLWPAFHRLIAERRPAVVFGEQVASKLGREWLAGVRIDLEDLGYAVGAADLCAAGVGAPHIRQRLFWVADATGSASTRIHRVLAKDPPGQEVKRAEPAHGGEDDEVADTDSERQQERQRTIAGSARHAGALCSSGVGNATSIGYSQYTDESRRFSRTQANGASNMRPWDECDAIPCLDGKTRRTQPGVHPLAHGVPARASKLRAYGNAIIPQVAAAFIRAFLETEKGLQP